MTTDDLFSQRQILSPSELNRRARSLLEGNLGLIWLEGEISNLSTPASGHAYFTLKDATAQVRCALFRNRRRSVALSSGMQIVVRARVSLYEARGEYQLIVESVEPAGEGLLRAQFEALKKRLAAEGLFDESRRQLLPEYPTHIAVITSPTGAALKDVLSVLERRYPVARVTVCPSLVQGEQAPAALRRALTRAVGIKPDVILLTRGGGSLEDLWAFNDEQLARQIADCPIPLVSAVGHEVDFSISDFVADQRAATPSVAAEQLVPDRRDLLARLDKLIAQLQRRVGSHQRQQQMRLAELGERLHRARPAARIQRGRERLTQLVQRLTLAVKSSQGLQHSRLQGLQHRLGQRSPSVTASRSSAHLAKLNSRLAVACRRQLASQTRRLDAASRALNAVSPLAVLNRGYSVTRISGGKIVTAAAQVSAGQVIETRVADGSFESVVGPGDKSADPLS